MEREVLINLFPKSDYEKLLFATRYINELKESLRLERIEKGKLLAEIDELNHKLVGKLTHLNYQLGENLKSESSEISKSDSIKVKDLKLEIKELKMQLKDEQNFMNRVARVEARKAEIHREYKEHVKTLEDKIQRYYLTRDDLINKLLLANKKNNQ